MADLIIGGGDISEEMEKLIKHLEVQLVLKVEEGADDFCECEVGSLERILEDEMLLVAVSICEVTQNPSCFEALCPE